jgi:photosystem II stability/assembly factor-like uncharacterized protein
MTMRKLFDSIRLLVAVALLPAAVYTGVSRAQDRGAWEGAVPEDKALHLRGRELNVVHTRHEGRLVKSDRDWVWIGGDGGYVFYTNDGEHWRQTKIEKNPPVTDIYFQDDEGYLLAGTTLYRSDDDGARWRPVHTFPLKNGAVPALYRMAFGGKNSACVVGVYIKKQGKQQSAAGSLVVCTNNGGETWVAREVKGNEELLHVDFLDDQNGWAVGVRGAIHRTRDGGITWERMPCPNSRPAPHPPASPQPCPPSSPTLFHVEFITPKHGWVVGAGASIFYTNDGGFSWQPRNAPASIPRKTTNLLSVKFIDPEHGWIVGSNGTILYTKDGGVVWELQLSGTTSDLYSLSLGGDDKRQAWAVGAAGTLLKFVPK